MANRPWNFSAGPSALPDSVLEQAAAEMLDWHGSGMSVMEMSHRGPEFTQICDEAEADLRTLLNIPETFAVLFMQGGATAENAIVPLNLMGRTDTLSADFVVSGIWSKKSIDEAQRYGTGRLAASSLESLQEGDQTWAPLNWMPAAHTWQVNPGAAYLHVCSNETIGGVEFAEWPNMADLGAPEVPLVVDASSHFLSRPIDFSKVGMVFAGAQKNAGPAGVTIVIVRRDLLGLALPQCPSAFDYANVAREQSKFNTPPTYSIYIAGLIFKWVLELGGIAAIEQRNIDKAQALYGYFDQSSFYRLPVRPTDRSRMNVPFFLQNDVLNEAFLDGAKQHGLMQLKGHKSVGGMRASIYNAIPLKGVQALIEYLKSFERSHG
jgi:phosphoserine aminotransferase